MIRSGQAMVSALDRADEELYRAKRDGRNQVQVSMMAAEAVDRVNPPRRSQGSRGCAPAGRSPKFPGRRVHGERHMRAAHWMTWMIAGAASLPCAAQVVAPQGDLLTDTYFGVNVGRADYRYTNPPSATVSALCSPATIDCRTDPVGWKVTAGYMIWPYFGIEAVAFSLGDAHDRTDLGGGFIFQQKVRIDGYGLSAVAALPVGPVTLDARAGYASATAARRDDINGSIVARGDKSRAEPIFGAGVAVTLWRGLFARLDWDRARARTEFGEKFEADLFSVGIG
jgi:hypothetical protein